MLARATTLGRCTATLLVVLWAAQPLVTLAHAGEHAHRFCPEHQAFEEATRPSGPGTSRLIERVLDLSVLRAALPETPRPSHEACPLLTDGSRGDALASEAAWVTVACLAVSRPATAPPQAHSPLPILATAPKSSPPARA